jgi:hypothetical protein
MSTIWPARVAAFPVRRRAKPAPTDMRDIAGVRRGFSSLRPASEVQTISNKLARPHGAAVRSARW